MSYDNKKILIVDDDQVTRKVISFALKKNHYIPFEAEDATDAFDVLNKEDISLVFCDVFLGDVDGFEFCQKVREQERYRALPFIFITAANSAEEKTKAFNIGADDFIVKPFNVEDLLIKANSILKRVEIYKVYGLKKKFDESFLNQTSKILLVDDDPLIAKLFSISLQNFGYDCRIEINAIDGYETCKTFQPDLVLSDFMMPDIDGFQFRKMLLNDPLTRDIPFIFLTANDSEDVMFDGFGLDIKDFILKTTNPKVIAVKIDNFIKNLKKERQGALNELQQAADSISMEVVPSEAPKFKGYLLNHWHVPYKGIPGGDFIDYIPFGDNKMVVVLGDIMGKKWGAWFFAFSFIGYIRSAIRVVLKNYADATSADILNKVNETVYADAKISEIFTTVSIIVIDNKKFTAQYSGAGDLPAIHFDAYSRIVEQKKSDGLLLGLSDDGLYNPVEIPLAKGDSLFLYTDGIVESRGINGDQFGNKLLLSTIAETPEKQSPFDYLKDTFSKYTENHFEDDVSLVQIKCTQDD